MRREGVIQRHAFQRSGRSAFVILDQGSIGIANDERFGPFVGFDRGGHDGNLDGRRGWVGGRSEAVEESFFGSRCEVWPGVCVLSDGSLDRFPVQVVEHVGDGKNGEKPESGRRWFGFVLRVSARNGAEQESEGEDQISEGVSHRKEMILNLRPKVWLSLPGAGESQALTLSSTYSGRR